MDVGLAEFVGQVLKDRDQNLYSKVIVGVSYKDLDGNHKCVQKACDVQVLDIGTKYEDILYSGDIDKDAAIVLQLRLYDNNDSVVVCKNLYFDDCKQAITFVAFNL